MSGSSNEKDKKKRSREVKRRGVEWWKWAWPSVDHRGTMPMLLEGVLYDSLCCSPAMCSTTL